MTEQVVRVRIDLKHAQPRVRRRVDVPISASLEALHCIIQVSMGWEFAHFHEFVVAGRRYADPEFLEEDYMSGDLSTHEANLSDLIDQGIKKFTYVYDFGDSWQHDINLGRVRETREGEEYPALIDASGRCPPEDCGGVYGYIRLIEVLGDPSHNQHEEMREWCGPFDPEEVDEQTIRAHLAGLVLFPKEPATR